ncbi:PepK [Saccharolobus islandicus]|uniref:PepK n=1 Tax=Saccharolobus islandicus TaxID=43080 RepID=UPI000ADF3EE2|nr:PepK [Sulfolobus islandicus]
MLSILKELKGKERTTQDLDRVYDFVKDNLCMASIKDIREQLGMTLEEFMAKFRDYIIRNYELISGGKEGIVKEGVLYGIIRRKR